MKLAREAREISGRDVFIAGSIGPLGDVGDREDDRAELFAEQAALLEGRGVDLFMLETFYDLDELLTAIDAVRAVSSLPIVALLTFDEDAETLGGVGAPTRRRGSPSSTAAIGANHGAGLQAALPRSRQMGADGRRSPRCRTSASRRSRAAASSTRSDARVLRRLRRARARARRAR